MIRLSKKSTNAHGFCWIFLLPPRNSVCCTYRVNKACKYIILDTIHLKMCEITRASHLSGGITVYANYIGPSVMTDAYCEGFPICDNKITINDRCVIKIIGIHWDNTTLRWSSRRVDKMGQAVWLVDIFITSKLYQVIFSWNPKNISCCRGFVARS